MEVNFRAMQNENYQLREYILNLQSRLLETQSDYPPAPAHINLATSLSGAPSVAERLFEQSMEKERVERERQAAMKSRPEVGLQEPGSSEREAMGLLRAAARQASEAQPPQRDSPYGLGADYANKRARLEPEQEAVAGSSDTKAPQ